MAKKAVKEAKAEVKEVGYVVSTPFRDKDNFELAYKKGHDVSHFDADRLARLVELGIVEHI